MNHRPKYKGHCYPTGVALLNVLDHLDNQCEKLLSERIKLFGAEVILKWFFGRTMPLSNTIRLVLMACDR